MRKIEEFTEYLFGNGVAEAMIEKLLLWSNDFRTDHEKYQASLRELRKIYGEHANELHSAILQKTASAIAFAGVLGLKMNVDHFINPVLPNCTWPQVDYSDYLREELSCSLPEYQAAENVLRSFCKALPPEQEYLYDAIREYQAHLATVCPKLAHYYGYMTGNALLPRILPAYHTDHLLTFRYTELIKQLLPFFPGQD